MNETIRKFGYPETLVKEYTHWVVLLRPKQPTLAQVAHSRREGDPVEVAALGLRDLTVPVQIDLLLPDLLGEDIRPPGLVQQEEAAALDSKLVEEKNVGSRMPPGRRRVVGG